MARLAPMMDRLPGVYARERGTQMVGLMSVVGVLLDCFDQDMDRVQRSHWLSEAFDREDLEAIGALVGVDALPWEPVDLYRERIKATAGAILEGSVTRDALDGVLARLVRTAWVAAGVRLFGARPVDPQGHVFARGPHPSDSVADLVEWPTQRRRSEDLLARDGVVGQGQPFAMHCDAPGGANLTVLVRGVVADRTDGPVLVSRRTRQAVGFWGTVPIGSTLALVSDGQSLVADLDGEDVTDRVWTAAGWDDVALPTPDPRPLALRLEPGENVWALGTVGTFDGGRFDRSSFAMPTLLEHGLRPGVFGGGGFGGTGFAGPRQFEPTAGQSAFHAPPVAVLDAWWFEPERARFRFRVPRGAVLRDPGRNDDAALDEERFVALLDAVVARLCAAGIDGGVTTKALTEVQPMRDRLEVRSLRRLEESGGSSGEDAVVGRTAVFDHGHFGPDRFE